jgi:hypothetical protein
MTMNPEPTDLLWQQMAAEVRQQVIALLVQMLLRWLTVNPEEVSDERGE